MEYRNTRTGAIISTPCVVSGGNWVKVSSDGNHTDNLGFEISEKPHELYDEVPTKNKVETTEIAEEIEVESGDESFKDDDAYNSITKKLIMQELDAFKVEYDRTAKKAELYKLMLSQGK